MKILRGLLNFLFFNINFFKKKSEYIKTLIIVEASYGINIKYSEIKDEYVLPPGSILHVTSIKKNNNCTVIELKQEEYNKLFINKIELENENDKSIKISNNEDKIEKLTNDKIE